MSYDPVQWQLDRRAEAALHTKEFHKHHPEYLTPKEDKTVSTPKIPTEIRATVKAWFTSDYHGPQSLMEAPERAVTSVAFSNSMGMAEVGWSLAGEADIVLRPLADLVDSKVAALLAQKTNVLAEAQVKATEIEGQIQRLLAISYDAPPDGQEVAP